MKIKDEIKTVRSVIRTENFSVIEALSIKMKKSAGRVEA